MCSQLLNTIGLGIDIVGGIFLFIWGPPQPDLGEIERPAIHRVQNIMDDGRTMDEHISERIQKRSYFQRLSRFGMALIIIGFILQLIALWI